MAIVPMKRLELYGLKRHKASYLAELQRLGLVELIKPAAEEGGPPRAGKRSEGELHHIDERLAEIPLLAVFERFAPTKTQFC